MIESILENNLKKKQDWGRKLIDRRQKEETIVKLSPTCFKWLINH
jgi:hypothetical protein